MVQVKMLYPEDKWVSDVLLRRMVRDTMINQGEMDFNVKGASVAECVTFLMKNGDTNWMCMECDRKFTLRTAEKAKTLPVWFEGCPKCGGSTIDLLGRKT